MSESLKTIWSVTFTGSRSDSGGLSWGQQHAWRTLQEMAPDHWPTNTSGIVPVPPGTAIDRVLAAVETVMTDHESLRTHYLTTPDGETVQSIRATGTLEIGSREAVDGDLDAQALDLVNEMATVSFDLRDELPVRFAVLLRDGAPVRLVYATTYLALDGWSGELIEKQLTALVAGEQARPPADRLQPIDLAREESSGRGNRDALDFWRRHLMDIPQTMHPVDGLPPDNPRWAWVRLRSQAMLLAAERISLACRASPGSVLLAAFGATLCAGSGVGRFATKLMTSNRIEPRLHGYIGNLGTHSIISVDLAEETLTDLVSATHDAALESYFHGRHDTVAARRLRAEVERARGVHVDLGVFNYFSSGLRMRHDLDDGGSSRPTRFDRLPGLDIANTAYYAQVLAIDGEVSLEFLADTTVIPAADVEPLLMGMEALLVAAAGRDVPMSDVPALVGARPDAAGLVLVDGCLVRPAAVHRLVLETGLVADAAVVVDSAYGEPSLTAHVVPTDPALTPQALHDRCVDLLPGRRTAIAPARYQLYERAPAEPGAWAGLPVLRRGTGRP